MSDSTSKGKSAAELFPGLMPSGSPKAESSLAETALNEIKVKPPAQPVPQAKTDSLPPPPPKPDLSWLKSGELRQSAKITDIPSALVVAQEEKIESIISEGLKEFDFQIEYGESEEQAIERLKHQNPAIIIYQFGGTQETLDESKFHRYMRSLAMTKRRSIIYILVNSQFKTLYNLQALTLSANLVVNDNDIEHIAVIIRKALQDYNSLFGPFNEAIHLHKR